MRRPRSRSFEDPWRRTVHRAGWVLAAYALASLAWCIGMRIHTPPQVRGLWFLALGGEAAWTAGMLAALRLTRRALRQTELLQAVDVEAANSPNAG